MSTRDAIRCEAAGYARSAAAQEPLRRPAIAPASQTPQSAVTAQNRPGCTRLHCAPRNNPEWRVRPSRRDQLLQHGQQECQDRERLQITVRPVK
eukprot:6162322-Prymnesium_polylepis.2